MGKHVRHTYGRSGKTCVKCGTRRRYRFSDWEWLPPGGRWTMTNPPCAPTEPTPARLRAVYEAARVLVERWPEGGCVVTPPCGDCTWCRFETAVNAPLAGTEEQADG